MKMVNIKWLTNVGIKTHRMYTSNNFFRTERLSNLSSILSFENLKNFFYDIIKKKGKIQKKPFPLPPRPKKVLKIYEIYDYKKTRIKIKSADGFICAKAIIPYPPGYPVIAEGEVINKDIIEYLEEVLGKDFIEENEVDVVDER